MLEQLGGLPGREPQLGHAHFGQLAARSQPRQRQRRVAAAGQHHAYPGRPVLDEERERLVHLRRADHVVIIEDQQGLVRGQPVDQRRDQALERRRRGRAEQRGHPFTGPGAGPVQRGHGVAPEPGRVVIPASSDSHATGNLLRRVQSASRTVLPYPAGAQVRMTPRARPSSSRAVSRGRGTSSGPGAGT